MPRKAKDYSKSCVYVIRCKNQDIKEIYIGSTCNFTNRKGGHKKCVCDTRQASYYSPVYKYIRNTGGWDNWEMLKLETCNCDSYEELCLREKYYFDLLKPTLNHNRPIINKEEKRLLMNQNCALWRKNNPNYYKEYWKNKR